MPSFCRWIGSSSQCSIFFGLILLTSCIQCLPVVSIICQASRHLLRIRIFSQASNVEIRTLATRNGARALHQDQVCKSSGANALHREQECKSIVRHELTCRGKNGISYTRDQAGLRAVPRTLRLKGAGIVWREYFTSATLAANASIYVCFGCGTHIATTSDVISRSFQV